jgi:hypothetical protein
MKNHIEHAVHNESVSNYLSKHEKYSDWVITTSFYSALHFVRHLMLPETIGGEIIHDFERLYNKKKLPVEGRHRFQLSYIQQTHPSIAMEYSKLFEMANNSRYNSFGFTREHARLAKGYTVRIKEYTEREKQWHLR